MPAVRIPPPATLRNTLAHTARKSPVSAPITSPDALQAHVGKLGAPRDMKVIDFVDTHAARWLRHSSLGFIAFADKEAIALTLFGGTAGSVRVDDPGHVSFATELLDSAEGIRAGSSFGSLWVVPGIGETLRINGRVEGMASGRVTVALHECYLHCAKALIRSDFWSPQGSIEADADPFTLLPQCRFMALATVDGEGRADVSPKGDPAGALLRFHDGALWYPDRPGNRRVDSFRNLIEQPFVAALALVPGDTQCLHITGRAGIHADGEALAMFSVEGKVPKLATRVAEHDLRVGRSAALARAAPWPANAPPADIEPAAIFRDHVKLSRSRGVQAALVRATVSVPGLMRKGLDSDYKNNLY